MKTIKKGIYFLLISLFLTLTACTSEEVVKEEVEEEPLTKVKVVSLSYETQEQELGSNNTFNLSSSKPINYIFPGDELAFTVEIEDPDFEFISLLSLKLNDQMIRANTTDAITSTRDCGLNICVDFPYPVSSGVTTYSLTELKFATLGSNDPIDALIENDAVSVSIEIWEDSVSPYVEESVELLNEILDKWAVYQNLSSTIYEEWVIGELTEEEKEGLYIELYNGTDFEKTYDELTEEEKEEFKDNYTYNDLYNLISDEEKGEYSSTWKEYQDNAEAFQLNTLTDLTRHLMIINFSQVSSYQDYFSVPENFNFPGSSWSQGIQINEIIDTERGDGSIIYYENARVLSFGIYSLTFSDAFFSSQGNTIFFNFNGEAIPFITLGLKSKIVPVTEEYITTWDDIEA